MSPEELAVRRAGGYGAKVGMGERPAVLVIDVVYGFTGDKGDDHLTSVAKFRTSCGPAAWQAIPHIQRLLSCARERGVPVIYTRAAKVPAAVRGSLRPKRSRTNTDTPESRARGNEFPPEIAPTEMDIVVEKTSASGFFQTPLLAHLQMLRVDHLIVAGTSTSGCVRATVYDAFAYTFGITVVEECVFDRFPTSHKVNLFDMDSKFADVEPLDVVVRQLEAITGRRPTASAEPALAVTAGRAK